uniref:Uncharacterized protein n=1 Tax=Cacopsylla melanoneura TaxID=428564 RepID=A0A8D8X3J0_9HEMI
MNIYSVLVRVRWSRSTVLTILHPMFVSPMNNNPSHTVQNNIRIPSFPWISKTRSGLTSLIKGVPVVMASSVSLLYPELLLLHLIQGGLIQDGRPRLNLASLTIPGIPGGPLISSNSNSSR